MDLSHKIPHRSQSISMKTKRLAIFSCILFLFLNIHESHSYGDGAPAIPSICSSMTPEHHTEPQSSPSPYTIQLEKTDVMGGQPVKVTLTSVDRRTPFKGFLVMGQKFKEEKLRSVDTPMGQFGFGVGSNSDIAKLIKCGGQSVATHNSSQAKNEIVIEWTAPNEDGEYMIVGTFVQSFDRFWVRQPSAMIRVKKDAGLVVAEAPAPVAPKLSEATMAKLQDFYSGCTSNKACYGLPSGCVESQTCEMLTTFRVAGSRYLFQVTGQLPEGHTNAGYVASGLSFDASMGADSVIGCVYKDGGVSARSYYNIQGGKNNGRMTNPLAGLTGPSVGNYIDGYVFCEFSREEKYVDVNNEIGQDIDLLNGKFHILLARAADISSNGPNGEKLGYHVGAGDKGVSSEAVPMTYIGILKAKSPILVELHGGFMIIAWLMCASTGMFTARYYKQTHTDFNPLNKAFWFLLHISCMFTTAFMTACGIIFIFVEVGGYSEGLNGPASWHPILGIILTVLAAMQVLIAFFRPHPGTPNRPYFNWIHWTIGNSAHIVGIACIFLSQKLSKTGLEENWGYLGVIVAFVIFHVVMHVVMSIHTVWADKQLDIQNKMRAVRPGPMKPSGKSEEAPGTGFRTFMLTLYIFGVAGTSIALVVMVAIAV